jgi:CBS domain containing-hemolysin-like protein
LDSTDSIWYGVLILLLVLSAFFSAAETAFATVNKHRLGKRAEEVDARAALALRVTEKSDRALFAILVGNTTVNILFAVIAALLGMSWMGLRGAAVATAASVVVVLVFGGILPKTYAGDNSEGVALLLARPLIIAMAILAPLTVLCAGLRLLFYKMLPQPKKGPSVTEEELIEMIGSIEEEGVIEEQERELVKSALQFDEIAIHEILTPRVNIVAIDVESTPEEIRQTVVEEGYARIPVYEENIDSIIGVLYSREYLNAVVSGKEPKLRDLLSKPLFVHKRMKLSQILTLFKAEKSNLAVVTDDYGGTLGIVTMEDVLEELVGDIWDEDDEIPEGLIKLDDLTVEVNGDHSLEDTFEALGLTEDDADSDYTTVNGWALHLFEHVPEAGESCTEGEFALVALEMDGHRIKRLRVARRPAVAVEN